jgi:hypothetical protein
MALHARPTGRDELHDRVQQQLHHARLARVCGHAAQQHPHDPCRSTRLINGTTTRMVKAAGSRLEHQLQHQPTRLSRNARRAVRPLERGQEPLQAACIRNGGQVVLCAGAALGAWWPGWKDVRLRITCGHGLERAENLLSGLVWMIFVRSEGCHKQRHAFGFASLGRWATLHETIAR